MSVLVPRGAAALEEGLDVAFADSCDELAEGVTLQVVPGSGRGLSTVCRRAPNEWLLVAPVTCAVRPPAIATPQDGEAGTQVGEAAAPCVEEGLAATYAEVSRICDAARSTFAACFYWSALAALVASDGPASGAAADPGSAADPGAPGPEPDPPPPAGGGGGGDGGDVAAAPGDVGGAGCGEEAAATQRWVLPPPVPEEFQERLLHLYRPRVIASKCTGRGDDGRDAAALELVQSLQLRCSQAKFEQLVLVFKYNSFSTNDNEEGALEVFFAPSFCNHSCAPNCGWRYDEAGRFALFAGEDGLAEGDPLSISYLTRDCLAMSTLQRREELSTGWHFFCQCARCVADAAVPRCAGCGALHSVFLSGRDESPYTGFDVDCDACGEKDLACEHGYFFHCFSCGQDLCPGCSVPA